MHYLKYIMNNRDTHLFNCILTGTEHICTTWIESPWYLRVKFTAYSIAYLQADSSPPNYLSKNNVALLFSSRIFSLLLHDLHLLKTLEKKRGKRLCIRNRQTHQTQEAASTTAAYNCGLTSPVPASSCTRNSALYHLTMFWSLTDWNFNVVPQDYNKAENFLSPSGTVTMTS